MNKTLKGAVVALGFAGAALAMTSPANAQGVGIGVHVGDVGIGIGVGANYGNVAYGYRDGYWDHHHAWHRWQNDDELNRYRAMQGARYYDWQHDRDPDQGWHDEGVGVHVGDVGIGIGVGADYVNVAYGYQDGYWDHHHAWHAWRDDDEMNRYRAMQGNHYSDWRHDRDPDQGWHDEAR